MDLKYPIGRFSLPAAASSKELAFWIERIEKFPVLVRQEVTKLSVDQLEWKYRPDGWCIRQVVHHCADSHLNSLTRFKLALTEDCPEIRPYLEAQWAELSDVQAPVEWSLMLMEGLHQRWIMLLKGLTTEDLERTYVHPEHRKVFTLMETIAMYAWHCDHHLAHIRQAIASKGTY